MARSTYSLTRLARSLAISTSLVVLSHFNLAGIASAQTVWSGLTFNYTHADGLNPTDPANQDRITNEVWITRGQFGGGLLNAAPPTGSDPADCDPIFGCNYQHNLSPVDTEWATSRMLANSDKTIAATNYQNLAFTNWEGAYSNQVGVFILDSNYRNAVVHLIDQNIYLDLQFTGWSSRGGGGFSYLRSVAPSAPAPNGDYNHDGTVNAADYVLWRKTLTQAASPAGSGADGNANGTIDSGDYDFWRARFGNTPPGSGALGSAVVPEPATLVLQLAFLSILLHRQRKAN
jgi:hypothetical protein